MTRRVIDKPRRCFENRSFSSLRGRLTRDSSPNNESRRDAPAGPGQGSRSLRGGRRAAAGGHRPHLRFRPRAGDAERARLKYGFLLHRVLRNLARRRQFVGPADRGSLGDANFAACARRLEGRPERDNRKPLFALFLPICSFEPRRRARGIDGSSPIATELRRGQRVTTWVAPKALIRPLTRPPSPRGGRGRPSPTGRGRPRSRRARVRWRDRTSSRSDRTRAFS